MACRAQGWQHRDARTRASSPNCFENFGEMSTCPEMVMAAQPSDEEQVLPAQPRSVKQKGDVSRALCF